MAVAATLDVKTEDVSWHALSNDESLEKLQTSKEGLSSDQANSRRESFGPNRLPEKKRSSFLIVFIRQFKDPLIYVLLIAGLVSLGIGNYNNAIFIFAVLLINSVIGTIQEWKAESSARSLEQVIQVRARVIRDGERTTLNAEELVPGDIVLLESGLAVPADLRLLSAKNVRADESLLTGESMPVEKVAAEDLPKDTPLGDRKNLLHAGSSIMSGSAQGVVCRTGTATEVGRIAKSLAEGGEELPPLVLKMKAFTQKIAIIILLVVMALAVFQYLEGESLAHIFFLAVALAVSAIPAGLPVAITVALSIASSRMAKRKVIVRKLPAVEGLGSCTLIASDKTGTLTENKLTAKKVLLADKSEAEIGGEGYDVTGDLSITSGDKQNKEPFCEIIETGTFCNEGEVYKENGKIKTSGDTVDIALLVLAKKIDLNRKELIDKYPQTSHIPFESEKKFAAAIHWMDGQPVAHVKGAAERVLKMCENVDTEAQKKAEENLAQEGYRVIALARGPIERRESGEYEDENLKNLKFLGFVGLIDPVREAVPEAVRKCHSANVDVRMITGDHPDTALNVGRRIGLAEKNDRALTGAEIEHPGDDREALKERVVNSRVFARVEPSHKTRIVGDLQDAGHFVAVTGDGVNDAPALRKAHIGIAMGEGGTDVARGAADLILTDNNFASIVAGIEEGRIAYDNIRKVIWLLLSTGAAEVLLFFLSLFTGLPLPLTAIQLLWLNLVTNGIQDVALAFEAGEGDVLDRPPRSPNEPVFNRQMIEQVALSGAYIGIVAFVVYYILFKQMGLPEFEARNLLLLLMVLFENIHIFSCRSERRSLFRIRLMSNPLLIFTVILAQGAHIASMFIPGLNDILEIEPVSVTTWLVLLPIAVSLLLFDEVAKWVQRTKSAA